MPFAATQTEIMRLSYLEIIILCKVSQIDKDKYHRILLICEIFKK